MKRLLKVIPVLAAGVLFGASGCADNEGMLFVRQVIALPAGNCQAAADPSGLFWSSGVLDLALRDSYEASLLVGNQLVRRGSRDLLRTESSRVIIRGAEVALLNDQKAVISEFSVPAAGFIDPGSGDEPGYGVTSALLVPPGTATAGTRIVAEVRVFGDTLGGDEITSAALAFPITVCNGCLISYPADADDPAQPGYQCASSGSDTSGDPPCRLGQDEAVDCRLCAGVSQACLSP